MSIFLSIFQHPRDLHPCDILYTNTEIAPEDTLLDNYFSLSMDKREINQISALGLAHCGDAVFELLVRSWLCASGRATAQNLHRATVSYVRAGSTDGTDAAASD